MYSIETGKKLSIFNGNPSEDFILQALQEDISEDPSEYIGPNKLEMQNAKEESLSSHK